jgi:Pyruvate/2-oxoacid:ferredoxin oxidoreductase delta subunit
MAKRGGGYPGRDIPEFYALAMELFLPEEAEVSAAMPRGPFTAAMLAETAGRPEDEATKILEKMADRGLCSSAVVEGTRYYAGPPFVPGIFEFQFMRGTTTDRDRKLARLIHAYKAAVDAQTKSAVLAFPAMRVISVDRLVQSGNQIHTYDQVNNYIDQYDPISVSTCFCRHEAELIDPADSCGRPNETCFQFGFAAQFVAERKMGRIVTKDEARTILDQCEKAGLVHCSQNAQEIDFLCNCCSCHCMILQTALKQPKPAFALFSSFQPTFDEALCTACGICVDRCPGSALALEDRDVPEPNMDRCFGCGVCATGCPSEAVQMTAREDAPEPPKDRQALKAAARAARQA